MIAIKKRTLTLQNVNDSAAAARLVQSLEQLAGVQSVQLAVGGLLRIEYDLFKINLARLEQELENGGHPAATGRWQRFRRWVARYTEVNERDNLTAPNSPCCSDPKALYKRKRK